jgi:hypothetical protein
VFDRIAVWRDDYAPEKGAFARAVDWSARLAVPLRVVDPVTAPSEFFRDGELGVVGAYLTAGLRDRLLAEYAHAPDAAALICPHHWRPNGRMLILNKEHAPAPDFLTASAKLCRALGLGPVVLTVAVTERRALACQGLAREALVDTDAEFDLVAGCELRTAVEQASRARGCSGVIMEVEPALPWWRLRGDPIRVMLGVTHALGIVVLPHSHAAPVASRGIRN